MRISKSTKTTVKASCNSGDYKQCLKDALVAKGGYRKSDVEDQSTATLESWAKDVGIDIDNVCACGDVKASTDYDAKMTAKYKAWAAKYGYDKLSDMSDDALDELYTNIIDEREGVSDNSNKAYFLDSLYGDVDDERARRKQVTSCSASTSTDKALQHIKAAIDILGKSGKKDDVTMDSIANLATVMFDMNSSKSDK